ncbi:hypothetical protein [Streptomyces sp. NPDC059786]|uniref:hypothetical protein n=1 Tax=Streptomyces sp. NPDC059786 TaxID=3346946 RepID=UPI00364FCE76
MRIHATTATAGLLLAALTACGGSGDGGTAAGPKASTPATKSGETSAEPSQDAEQPSPGTVEKGMALGDPAQTTGDGGTGVLEITPDSIVFTKGASGETAENGMFAVVVMKDRAMTAVAADEPAPISGGGWQWMAADGEMVGFDSGQSSMVTMDKYDGADPVQPGGWQWRAQVFDLTPEQAKGGTLIYIDGEEKAHRWEMPSADSGPNVADVKKRLAG